MSKDKNEFVKVRWFEHPVTGEGHQFLVQKRHVAAAEFPHKVVVSTWSGSHYGECVLRYSSREKQEESFFNYFSEEEMLEFFNELVLAAESHEQAKAYCWRKDSGEEIG